MSCVVVYLDISKVSHTISYNILIDKLMKNELDKWKTFWTDGLKRLWSATWSPAGGQSLAVCPRGQY